MAEGWLIVGVRRLLEFALLTLVVLALAAVFLGRIVPLTGLRTLVIDGRSMEPTIPIGSAVLIAPIAPADLAPGQIVTMRVGPTGALFTHRVTRLVDRGGETWVETKGDANTEIDPAITPATSIVGRVDWTFPMAGYLVSLVSVPVGIVFVLSLGGALIVALWLLDDLEADLVEDVRGGPARPPLHARARPRTPR